MAVAWDLGTRQARTKTEWQLDYGVMDVYDTVAGAIDTMLNHVARTAVRRIGSPRYIPMDQMSRYAKELDVDEINVVDREGKIIASNDPCCMGVVMAGDPVMDDFMRLTNGTVKSVSQPFRPHARNSAFRAKYLASAFPGGNGFVQVGLDERRLSKMLPHILENVFDGWIFGRTGFFLCASVEDDRLVSNPSRHRNKARTFEEAGCDTSAVAACEIVADGKTYGKTFVQTLYGEKCYCRAFVFGAHRFVAALPEREFYDTRDIFAVIFGILLFVVLSSFAFFLDRISRDAEQLKAFYLEEDRRRAKDMAVATRIQESAIPRMFPPFAGESRMDIFASMFSAKDVGGDFYDFYFTTPDKMTFLVADVSGKGVPAALFMMNAMATIRGFARTGLPLEEVAARTNDILSRDNEENMFVTAWIGEIDLSCGSVKYVNAGHNPPLLFRHGEDSGYASPVFLRERSGAFLGAMPGMTYKPYTIQLLPGDMIYLYTDGITEQADAKGELFGENRLAFSLEAMLSAGTKAIDGGSSPLLAGLFDAVLAHGSGVEQSDDCTQLAIRYNGQGISKSFDSTQEGVSEASSWLDEILETSKAEKASAALHIILDEICSNIVRYSGATVFDISAQILHDPNRVRLVFSDDGKAYDPLSHTDPDTTLPAKDRPIGGLGIMMVKKMGSPVVYCRDGGRNRLSVERAF